VEHAPYDAIMLTAAGEAVDQELFAQLAPDGVLVAPVGPPGHQRLLRYHNSEKGWVSESLGAVSFVPLLGGIG
jgi:protein-L-isoaspartate(D-aspartate) O-methyltransferase